MKFLVQIKRGKEVLHTFEEIAPDSMTAGVRHLCLKPEDAYIFVRR